MLAFPLTNHQQMVMKPRIQALFLLLLMVPALHAQKEINSGPDYKNAIGIRAGKTSGVTFKHFFNTGNAGEFILGLWTNAVGLTMLYEKNMSPGPLGLKFYYGAGAHATAETGTNYYRKHNNRDQDYVYRYGDNGLALGIDGVVGLDYKIGVVPLAISVDLKPFLEVSNYGIIYTALDAGLGIKLAF
jgi:hypothetical protein